VQPFDIIRIVYVITCIIALFPIAKGITSSFSEAFGSDKIYIIEYTVMGFFIIVGALGWPVLLIGKIAWVVNTYMDYKNKKTN